MGHWTPSARPRTDKPVWIGGTRGLVCADSFHFRTGTCSEHTPIEGGKHQEFSRLVGDEKCYLVLHGNNFGGLQEHWTSAEYTISGWRVEFVSKISTARAGTYP